MLQLEIVIIPNQSNQDEQTGETLLVTKENESWKSISSLLDRNPIISESDVTNAFFVRECEEKNEIWYSDVTFLPNHVILD